MTDDAVKGILLRFYDADSDLFKLLWRHSNQVAQLSERIALQMPSVDSEMVRVAALLHDVGVIRTNAPSIFCLGSEPYICHGILGAEMLRGLSSQFEPYALVCERHTGAGLSREDIISEGLPLPQRDFLPVSMAEKIVCYADKFFSKSNVERVKTPESIRRSLSKFGDAQVARFDEMHRLFCKYL